ncbi:MAG: GntR family transcriptional regulator [Muribaculaceae bacterium]|nr:GntR family transcriptional regulator [Muribaculaceae bacterium]
MVFKENTKAIYLQIADKICDEVMVGSIRQGDRIPSVREYASTLQVNANTVMRSYDYLDKAGVIFNRRGIGFFIAEDACERILTMRREAFYCGEMQDFFHKINLLGITPEELTKLYTNYLDTKK